MANTPNPIKVPVSPVSLGEGTLKPARWPMAQFLGLFFLLGTLGFIFALYSSGGRWSDWPTSSTYYDQLGEAFLHGQTYLLTEPDPRLASIQNPYSEAGRKGIPIVWDASYFQGHYYLYWGPVPGLIVAIVRVITNTGVGDNAIVFFMSEGILLFTVLILFRLRALFFPQTPFWIFSLSTIAASIGNPLLWLLNRPMVYEAAITSGQLFFLAGCFVILPAFHSPKRRAIRYTLAALLWVLAVASRITLVFGVGVLALAVSMLLLRGAFSRTDLARKWMALWLPLVLGAAMLCGYNQVRFGSPWESGFRYQFTDNDYTQNTNAVFSIWNMPLNFYNYFARYIVVHREFPFIEPVEGKATYNPLPISHPSLYYSEPVTGLPISTPFLFCAFGLCLPWAASKIFRKGSASMLPTQAMFATQKSNHRFLWMVLFLSGMAIFVPLLLYWYCSERFILDFIMLFLLLAACGMWTAYDYLFSRGGWGKIGVGLLAGSAVWTTVVSLLLGVTGYGSHW
jgi:hypothetical protein